MNSSAIPKVAVIGAGYWGKNLVRNFYELSALAAVVDVSPAVLQDMRSRYGVKTATEVDAVLDDPTIAAVVIAAPAVQHYQLVKRSLLSGKDVFVEKPLALHISEGSQLVEMAAKLDRILMVGHILEYHPAIRELKRLIKAGDLGKLQYIYSSRLNLGKLRAEENILWSFAPHDISVILSLLGELPERVSAQGGTYLNPPIVDTTLTTCDFAGGVKAHIFVSWLHPFKEQKLAIIADKKMAVFDDTQPINKLVLYSHRIEWPNRIPVAQKDAGTVVDLPSEEPLRVECQHFLDSVRDRTRPLTDGESALKVLQVLEASERSLLAKGHPVAFESRRTAYQAHESAVVDQPCAIGAGTKIWHFSHIMANSRLGENCVIGQNVLVSPEVVVGNNVKIQNNVALYTGVELEDDVFCGPSMVFTNVVNPRSHIVRKHEFRKTLVKRGATLGANSTVVCGTTIGEYAFVAAGAVVTRDVPNFALIMGVPGRQVGWMCYCGIRLDEAHPECSACGRQYSLEDGECKLVSVPEPAVMMA